LTLWCLGACVVSVDAAFGRSDFSMLMDVYMSVMGQRDTVAQPSTVVEANVAQLLYHT
jgi:hypothetical protein